MKLNTIKIIRGFFLILIILMIVMEATKDSICVSRNYGYLSIYLLDLICYLSILYSEIL
jgi:hypothetical protein